MALISQTQWHGNPRPWKTYHWVEFIAQVLSPVTGQLVPTYNQGVSSVPFAEKDDDPTGTIDVAGPAALTTFSLAGPFPKGTRMQISGTRTGGVEGAFGDDVTLTEDMGPEQAAALWGIRLRGNDELTTEVAANSRSVDVIPVAPATAITLSSIIITPPA
jgi:hypothetical protein